MAYENRGNSRYYYESRRTGRRVRRIYYRSGKAAEVVAGLIGERKAVQARERDQLRAERAVLEPLERALNDLDEACRILMAAVLYMEGFHRHDRSAWRKRRGQ